MRHLILRRRARVILLVILLAVITASVIPWAYYKFFIDREGLFDLGPALYSFKMPEFFRENEIDRAVSIDINFLNNGYMSSELHIEGLNLKGPVISGNVFVKGRFIKDNSGKTETFSGKLFSDDISINSKPFMPVKASFDMNGAAIEIKSLRFGRAYEIKGRIGLEAPFETDLRLDVKRADIRDLARIARPRKSDIALGMMNGVFYFKGKLSNLYSNGILESRNGRVGRVEYDVATIRIEGFGPIINIVDSRARWGKSLLTIEGYIDLRNIEKGTLFDGLRVKSDMKTIVWDGWDIDQKNKDELSMSKDISDKMRVGFKAFTKEPLTHYRDRENPDEMNLEYKMGQEHLKMKIKENEEFFGIEHSVKF
ncbi:MAG: hypothetical protein ABH815_03905 [Candidatus Omnitrophota bacterium]